MNPSAPREFEDKVALVTGVAAMGARVVLLARSPREPDEVATSVRALGGVALVTRADRLDLEIWNAPDRI